MEYGNARGEENDVLVGCLYELRMKFTKDMVGEIKREKDKRGRYD